MPWPANAIETGQCLARNYEVVFSTPVLEDVDVDAGVVSVKVAPVPQGFMCPITSEIMLDPVMTVDGQV